jgi:hypothetical protein
MAKASWSFRDLSDEISNVQINVADVSAGGADFDDVMADVAALGAALSTVSDCVQAKEMFLQAVDVKDPTTPTDPQAQREVALRIFYADDVTGEVYHISVPGPDFELIELYPNTDIADLTDSPLDALVTAIEASALSPVGNAVTVLRAIQVGRHN